MMMKLKLVLLVMLSALAVVPASAADLNLETNPSFETINGKRYVFINKGGTVEFTPDPSKTPVTFTWVFDNGDPERPPGNGPHSVLYGENAHGKVNKVRLSSERTDENGANCVTNNKIICRVVVPMFAFKLENQEPEVRNYIADGATISNNKIEISSDLTISAGVGGISIPALETTRSSGDPITFTPPSGTTDGEGKFKTTLKTTGKEPDFKAKFTRNNIAFESEEHAMIPAKYKRGFFCTIYFTPDESGFTPAKGFTQAQLAVENRTVDGKTVSAKKRFWERVRIEGAGRLQTAQHGHDYVGYWSNAYHFISAPKGTHNIDLVEKYSCATDRNIIGRSWEIQTVNNHIEEVFGSSNWRGDDVGGAIQGYDIDLYFGDAEPLSAAQVDIPETTPQYNNQNNVAVILTRIP
jgi:hypothetical protein